MARSNAIEVVQGALPDPAGRPAYRAFDAPATIVLTGELLLTDGAALWRDLSARARRAQPPRLDIDIGGVRRADGGGAAIVSAIRADLAARGIACDIVGGEGSVKEVVDLYAGVTAPAAPRGGGAIEQLGRHSALIATEVLRIIAFVGEIVAELGASFVKPRTANWRAAFPLAERAGFDAIPIVVLINFLVGFVIAVQSANTLERYGATLYVADVVVLSMTRELAPLMTAIIVCGRSGAGFTAEIGTMKVSEEIDALRTMGFGPVRYLALPRLLALVLVTPVLTLAADVVGTIGGMVVAAAHLDITPRAYLIEVRSALRPWDIGSGLIKSVAFAAAIGLIACQRGFATRGGAEDVGRKTTSTVVTCLFALILIDAALSAVFRAVVR